jgi:hypothetical protein
MRFTLIIIAYLLVTGCRGPLTDPQKIVDKAIEVAGGDKFLQSHIEFDFRNRHYIAHRNGGMFSYERVFRDSTGTVHDFVSNDGFRREVNGTEVNIPDSMKVKYTSSTNSVIYFALLPYGLNDPAVIKEYIGETEIEGQVYYEVKVTFKQEGGGEDFEDEFFYWIHKENFTVDYFAYSFVESDEISFRFRKTFNQQTVNGIRLQDYINYKPENNSIPVDSANEKYIQGKLKELSLIELKNISVE